MASERDELIKFFISEIDSYMKPRDYQALFFRSLQEHYERNGSLSDKQFESLRKMYERITA